VSFCGVSEYAHIPEDTTLPVSTAGLERIYSKVELTLTDLCNTTLEERLEALILLQAHRKRVPVTDLSNAEIIDKFAACGSLIG
jgi:hypothetical protein